MVQENETEKQVIEGLEKEHEFYFTKLRNLEIYDQSSAEEDP